MSNEPLSEADLKRLAAEILRQREADLKAKRSVSPPATSHAVARSPEFRAFCQRFGIALDLPWRGMTIVLGTSPDSMMSVTQEYITRDAGPSSQED